LLDMIAELGGPFSVAGRGGKFCRRGWLDGTSDLVFASHSGLLGGGWTGDGVAARPGYGIAGRVSARAARLMGQQVTGLARPTGHASAGQ
jgi:hypothetical protein